MRIVFQDYRTKASRTVVEAQTKKELLRLIAERAPFDVDTCTDVLLVVTEEERAEFAVAFDLGRPTVDLQHLGTEVEVRVVR